MTSPSKIKLDEQESGAPIEASSRDISAAGVFVNVNSSRLEAQQAVHLELTLTIGKLQELFGCSSMVTLEVEGSVVRSLSDGVFIRFGDHYSIFPYEAEGKSLENAFRPDEGERRVGS